MSKLLWSVSVLSVAVLLFAGCSQSTQVPESAAQTAPSGDAAYLLVEKPEHAQGVTEVRKNGNAAEEVIVEGRIGGSENPFVDGIAAFTIIAAMEAEKPDSSVSLPNSAPSMKTGK